MSDGPRISALIQGGLGNQLFIYAAAAEQAQRLGVSLELVVPASLPHGGFQLDGIATRCATHHRPEPWIVEHVPGARAVDVRLLMASAGYRGLRHTFVEASFAYDPRIERVVPGTTLRGYFQSPRYFAGTTAELRAEVAGSGAGSPWQHDWTERIVKSSGSIGVHVRRGDFTTTSNLAIHGIAGRAYFTSALTRLRDEGLTGEVFVFSDDPSAARSALDGHDVTMVDAPESTRPIEILRTLARTDAKIISNSSFSWWAAWLSEPGAPVIAPTPWHVDPSMASADLLPPAWVRLDMSTGRAA